MPRSIIELLEGVELSKEAKNEISKSYESAVNEKVNEIVADRQEIAEAKNKTDLENAINEEKEKLKVETEKYINEEIIPSLTDKVDQYLTYVINEWSEENKTNLEHSLKVELAENVISHNKKLLESFGVNVEGGFDKLKETQKALDEMKIKLDTSLQNELNLNEKNEKLEKSILINKIFVEKNLTESQKEKLIPLTEKLSFNDGIGFENKVKELIESEIIVENHTTEDTSDKKLFEEFKNPYLFALSEKL